jgi:hypothetical protein
MLRQVGLVVDTMCTVVAEAGPSRSSPVAAGRPVSVVSAGSAHVVAKQPGIALGWPRPSPADSAAGQACTTGAAQVAGGQFSTTWCHTLDMQHQQSRSDSRRRACGKQRSAPERGAWPAVPRHGEQASGLVGVRVAPFHDDTSPLLHSWICARS